MTSSRLAHTPPPCALLGGVAGCRTVELHRIWFSGLSVLSFGVLSHMWESLSLAKSHRWCRRASSRRGRSLPHFFGHRRFPLRSCFLSVFCLTSALSVCRRRRPCISFHQDAMFIVGVHGSDDVCCRVCMDTVFQVAGDARAVVCMERSSLFACRQGSLRTRAMHAGVRLLFRAMLIGSRCSRRAGTRRSAWQTDTQKWTPSPPWLRVCKHTWL